MPGKAPVVVIKKKREHAEHHGGAWKVAYADFVTALMALFIVLWLMNTNKQIREAVGGYFKDPSGTSKKLGTDMLGSDENFNVTKDNMSELREQLLKVVRQVPHFDKLKNHIEMTVTSEGLRIELLESASGTFFVSGDSRPNADGRDMLIALAQELGKIPNRIVIEGHTDSKPYAKGSEFGNWELSADRANAARRLMQENGFRENQVMEVRGFADEMLRKPQHPEDPSNRRVSVIVKYLTKSDTPSTSDENQTVDGASDPGGQPPEDSSADH
jgi:chemotaxis protein MotB